jgi:hypothetical protein
MMTEAKSTRPRKRPAAKNHPGRPPKRQRRLRQQPRQRQRQLKQSLPKGATKAAPATEEGAPRRCREESAGKAGRQRTKRPPPAGSHRGARPVDPTHGAGCAHNRRPSAEERYRMVQSAAYFIAEKDGFQHGCDAQYWARAEREIAVSSARPRLMWRYPPPTAVLMTGEG